MEMFYFQLAGIACLLGLSGYWIYSRGKVAQLNEQLMDKKIVINELAEHANKMEREINAVVDIKPVKNKRQNTTKSKAQKVVKQKTEKSVKPKTEKVAKTRKTKNN